MNIPRAIEIAFAHALRGSDGIGMDTVIRCWQSLRTDPQWNEEKDKTLPCVDVRCSPPRIKEGDCTYEADCSIIFATQADDDKDHAQVAAMYEAGQSVLDTLFAQSCKRAWGDEMNDFVEILQDELGQDFAFAGLVWGDPTEPRADGSMNIIGLRMKVVFARPDFVN